MSDRVDAATEQEVDVTPTIGYDTVEAAVRDQMSKALGGKRGILEAAVPTTAFTVGWLITHELRLSLGVGAAAAGALLVVVRLLQRSTPQFVLNSLIGIGIAAWFALRSGRAEDAFLPGMFLNAGLGALMLISIVTRWPAVGFMLGAMTAHDPLAWRKDPGIVKLCSRLTWLLILPNVVRLLVQVPLYFAGNVAALGISKVALGWPLQIASLGAMAWLLARGRTPVEPARP